MAYFKHKIKGSVHLFGDVFECVQEAEGQLAQHGQYLRRLYEIRPFMIVRQGGRCRGAGDEDNKLPG